MFCKTKGANNEQIKELDNGLKMLNAFLPRDIREVKGAGAAGGICGGLYSVYGGEIKADLTYYAKLHPLRKNKGKRYCNYRRRKNRQSNAYGKARI